MVIFLVLLALSVVVATPCFAAWVPLVTSDTFTGILTDMGATATGIISILLIVLGVGLLARIFSR